jgi:cold shock CspA family protein
MSINSDQVLFGIIRQFDPGRGFGFIRVTEKDGDFKSYFLHISRITSGEPKVGAGVHFRVGAKEKGTAEPAYDAVIGDIIPKFAKSVPVEKVGGVS